MSVWLGYGQVHHDAMRYTAAAVSRWLQYGIVQCNAVCLTSDLSNTVLCATLLQQVAVRIVQRVCVCNTPQ